MKFNKFIMALILMCIIQGVGCGGSSQVANAADNWVAMTGAVSGPEGALQWRFNDAKEPGVLTKRGDDSWRNMTAVSFSVRSDRSGALFLRLDQKDRGIFLTHFDAGSEWKRVRLTPAEFNPFGKTSGQLQPAKIAKVFLVDLNGSDGGATGERTVWMKDFASDLKSGFVGEQEAAVALAAFENGRLLDLRALLGRGDSAGYWCFLTSGDGQLLPMKLIERDVTVDGRTARLPVVLVDSRRPATLEMLFWPAGRQFNVRLQADGGGKGIQSVQGVMVVNVELARTRLAKLQTYVDAHHLKKMQPELVELARQLSKAESQSTLRLQADGADRVLQRLLELSGDAVRRVTDLRLEELLAPQPATLPIGLKAGQPVTVELIEPEFRIGLGQSFGFIQGNVSRERIGQYYRQLRQAGFNHYVMPLFWDQLVRDGEYQPAAWDNQLAFDKLVQLGYTLQAHSIIQSSLPKDVKKLKGRAFTQAAVSHLLKVAEDYHRRYGDAITIWEAINEPSSNPYGGFAASQRVSFVSELVEKLRAAMPGATVMVNDYDWLRGLEADKPWANRNIIGTVEFYRQLLAEQPGVDLLGLEWYPGLRVDQPQFKADVAEPCHDLLATSLYWDRLIALGRPLTISESNFPGEMKSGDKNGYAWGRWDDRSQSQAAVDTLRMALSRPKVIGWTWWSVTDDEPWSRQGGLYDSAGRPKPVLKAITKVIAAIKQPQRTVVQSQGAVAIPMLPGEYRISTDDGRQWLLRRDRTGRASLIKDSRKEGP